MYLKIGLSERERVVKGRAWCLLNIRLNDNGSLFTYHLDALSDRINIFMN